MDQEQQTRNSPDPLSPEVSASTIGVFGDGPADSGGVGTWSNLELKSDGTFERSHEDYFRGSDYRPDEPSGGVDVEARGRWKEAVRKDGRKLRGRCCGGSGGSSSRSREDRGDIIRVECTVESVHVGLQDEAMLEDIGVELSKQFVEGAVFYAMLDKEGLRLDVGGENGNGMFLPRRESG